MLKGAAAHKNAPPMSDSSSENATSAAQMSREMPSPSTNKATHALPETIKKLKNVLQLARITCDASTCIPPQPYPRCCGPSLVGKSVNATDSRRVFRTEKKNSHVEDETERKQRTSKATRPSTPGESHTEADGGAPTGSAIRQGAYTFRLKVEPPPRFPPCSKALVWSPSASRVALKCALEGSAETHP